MINKIVLGMCTVRMMSGTIEILAAFWMLRLNQVDKAFLINSGLAVIGPIVLLSTTSMGLMGIADKCSLAKWLWLAVGLSCMCIGVLKK